MAANVSAEKRKNKSVFNCQPLLTKPQTFRVPGNNLRVYGYLEAKPRENRKRRSYVERLTHALAIVGERAKRARHYQGCTNSSWCGIYMYGGKYAIIVAHATHT